MIPKRQRNPLEATADSIISAGSLLWDWLGSETPHVADDEEEEEEEEERAPSILDWFAGNDDTEPGDAIDTDGEAAEEEDDDA